jgi:AcrR family transcriptional regulator
MSGRRQTRSDRTESGATHPAHDGLGREYPDGHTQGAHGRQVSEIQRARMLRGMFELVGEGGGANATVGHVVARSGVSRRTFYEVFDDLQDCFVVAFDEGVERARLYVASEVKAEATWVERVRDGLCALLTFFDGEPDIAKLLVVGSLGGGSRVLECRRDVLAQITMLVDEGRGRAKDASAVSAVTAEGVVGGVLAVLHARLLEDDPGGLVELTGPLMSMIVLPYLGAPAARRELGRPVPERRVSRERAAGDPLRDLEMRITYRTVRVLMALAANPGSSNHTVADGAGIADQGQMSKLLARLHRLGLVENTGAGPARGEPNAWTLTAKGWEVHSAVAQQAGSV